MKSSNFIKLLSALLCVVLMFVSCGETASVAAPGAEALSALSDGKLPSLSTPSVKHESTEAETPLTWEDFFEISPVSKETFTEAIEIDGDLVASQGPVYVFKSAEVDAMNMVKETYSFYNIYENKVVLTVDNSYEYIMEAGDVQESEIIIDFDYGFAESPMFVIEVGTITREKYTEEEKEANFRIDEDYSVDYSYKYYDCYGNLLSENFDGAVVYINLASSSNGMDMMSMPFPEYQVKLDDITCYLDAFGRLKSSYNENNTILGGFDAENDTYGYYLYTEIDALFDEMYAIQVYEKASGKLVLQHKFLAEYNANVLENGNIFVQTITPVNDDLADYDVAIAGEKANIDSFIIDVATGEKTAVETEYLVLQIMTADYYREYMSLMNIMIGPDVEIHDVTLKDNFINMAIAFKIENKQLSINELAIPAVFVDNNLNVQCTSQLDDEPVMKLSDGTLVYNISYADYSSVQKIVKPDGSEHLLPETAELYDEFFIVGKNIYDYADMECMKTLDDNAEILTVIGDKIIVEYNTNSDNAYYQCYRVEAAEADEENEETGNIVYGVGVFGDETVIDVTNKYIVTQDSDTGVYKLYNANLTAVLVSRSNINIMSIGDCIYANSANIYYEIK